MIDKEFNEKIEKEFNEKIQQIESTMSEKLRACLRNGSDLETSNLESCTISELLEKTNAAILEFQKFESFGRGASAALAVRNGRLLKALKTKVKAEGKIWQVYAKENILDQGQRTIDKHIKIAEIPNVELHLSLGIERLNLLAGAVEGIESEDPIDQFLASHQMNFDLIEKLDFEDFKRRIDEISMKEKARAEGIEMDTETAAKMVERVIPLTDEVLAKAKLVKETGGKTEVFFNNLLSTEPNTNGHPAKNSKKKPTTRLKSFNKLAEEMKNFVKEAKEKKGEILRTIDAKSLDELLVELEALKSILPNQ